MIKLNNKYGIANDTHHSLLHFCEDSGCYCANTSYFLQNKKKRIKDFYCGSCNIVPPEEIIKKYKFIVQTLNRT